ncbi:hypothetical protein [Streptomyces halobius]|uniref:Uncharacterized protein n=1 Tax=Streptomyces halobius TaxID=2879846 RepID=A0ABY4M4C3_9ACTN|nr:hypothetical protein [Streptomyces halobius]UQA92604.1 hypothetical protein K9S39_12910 [Streptomyces halobius]
MAALHLSLPTGYPRTVARRLAWPAAVTGLAALTLVGLLTAAGHPLDPAATLAELAGRTVPRGGCAVWATVRFGSTAPATGMVVAGVLAKWLLIDRVVCRRGPGQALPALLSGALGVPVHRDDAERINGTRNASHTMHHTPAPCITHLHHASHTCITHHAQPISETPLMSSNGPDWLECAHEIRKTATLLNADQR